jgi:hypothetical protein
MKRLNPDKLHVTYMPGANPEDITLPRRYTLTHSDRTGELFLSIGNEYDTKQISKLYNKLMRDEVLAELSDYGDSPVFRVYCHISGGFVFGTAKWRYNIFQTQLPVVLEAIRYGDRTLFEHNSKFDDTAIHIHFQSTDSRFNKVENWGSMVEHR